MQNLTSLQNLYVRNCPSLVSLPEGGLPPNLTSLQIEDCQNIQTHLSDWGLHRLTSLKAFRISGASSDVVSLRENDRLLLPRNLTWLSINKLQNLESLAFLGIQNLNSLKELLISDCPKLRSFPADEGLPATLSRLEIKKCPILGKRCLKEKGEDWARIAHIPRIEIFYWLMHSTISILIECCFPCFGNDRKKLQLKSRVPECGSAYSRLLIYPSHGSVPLNQTMGFSFFCREFPVKISFLPLLHNKYVLEKERERIITAAWVSLKHWQHGNVRLQFAFHVSYPARLNTWWSRSIEEMLMLCSFWMEFSVQLLSGLRFWLNFVPFDSSFTRNFLCQLCSSCCCLPQFHVSITVIKLSSGINFWCYGSLLQGRGLTKVV